MRRGIRLVKKRDRAEFGHTISIAHKIWVDELNGMGEQPKIVILERLIAEPILQKINFFDLNTRPVSRFLQLTSSTEVNWRIPTN